MSVLLQDSGGFESQVSLSYVGCQRLSSFTCPFASYAVGKSVLTSGLRLSPSHLVAFMCKHIDGFDGIFWMALHSREEIEWRNVAIILPEKRIVCVK